ncbi:39078_t:CDS:2 [Gigaspora margarita]|uniref:39078_t:CDS:1 n=1 Tax=Gigaspora margarita TaxID=4874 RepID=A0ABM8VZ23_GIGMA|nr:39078_t:CDS:2 [Gigaspora margarita]
MKGWKLKNLLNWVEKERYWSNAAEEKKKRSGIGILIEEQ